MAAYKPTCCARCGREIVLILNLPGRHGTRQIIKTANARTVVNGKSYCAECAPDALERAAVGHIAALYDGIPLGELTPRRYTIRHNGRLIDSADDQEGAA